MDTVLRTALVKHKVRPFIDNLQGDKNNNVIMPGEQDAINSMEQGALMEQ